jgi:molybdate transport system substrate-binding protein
MPLAVLLRVPLVAMLACATAASGRAQAPAPALMVFAASDLGPAFSQIVPQFEQTTRTDVTLVLGSTGMLAQQIRNGAPADVFFAANESFITDLARENLTLRQTHTLYARGRIATVTLTSGGIHINDLKDLADPRVRRIAIANPQHAPYGLAAKQAMEAVGLWQTLEPKLVFGENVQQAVQFVRSGSADAGIVARSVADTSDLHWTLVDARLHAPLNQMAVVLARTKQPAASMSFLEFVNATQGRFVMRQFGFLLPGESF